MDIWVAPGATPPAVRPEDVAHPQVGSSPAVRRLAIASLVANIGIVVTGGAVRLTQSGLGCPTWPQCTDDSYIPTPEHTEHGVIEFGNRLLTFVLAVVVVSFLVAAMRDRTRPSASGRRELRRWALLLVLGIPAQAVLGGITVLTGLNPWSVMAHFLLSAVLVVVATVAVVRSREGDAPAVPLVPRPLRVAAYGLLALAGLVVALGTVVTGTGPHAGDVDAARTGFDPVTVSQLHAEAVMVTVGLTLGLWVALLAVRAPLRARRAFAVLFAVELAQGVIGYVQYFIGVPVLLVGLHMLGACVFLVATTYAVLTLRERAAPDALTDQPLSASLPGP